MISRRRLLTLATAAVGQALLAGCGAGLRPLATEVVDASENDAALENVDGQALTLAVVGEPYQSIAENFIVGYLAERGMSVHVSNYSTIEQANEATESGEADANYAQGKSQLNRYARESGSSLVAVAAVHYAPFGIYSRRHDELKANAFDATVAIPKDGAGMGRALQLLFQETIVQLEDPYALLQSPDTLLENPYGIKLKTMEADQLTKSLEANDFCVIPPEQALEANLHLRDAIAIEGSNTLAAQFYGAAIATDVSRSSDMRILALVRALNSESFARYLDDIYDEDLIPIRTIADRPSAAKSQKGA